MTNVSLLAIVAYVLLLALRRSGSTATRVGRAVALLVGVAPAAWVMAAHGVTPRLVVGFGVLFFVGSVLLKTAIYLGFLSKYVYPHTGAASKAVIQGFLSSGCEIGAAAVAFGLVFRNLGLWQVFGFGAGAAACEAITLSVLEKPLAGTSLGEHTAVQIDKLQSGPGWLAVALPVAERGVATTAHIACRGVLATGIASGRAWPIAVAALAFAFIDGFVMYGLTRKWEFAHPAVAARLFGPLVLVATGCVVAWRVAT